MQHNFRLLLQWLIIFLLPAASPVLAQNLALNHPAIASSGTASRAFDNDGTTRWISDVSDPQYIIVDLGSVQTIDRIRLSWENAYGQDFTLDISSVVADKSDASWTNVLNGNWDNVKTITGNKTTANEYANLGKTGRYVRMRGTVRATTYSYSLYEFEVFNYSVSTGTSLAQGKPAISSSTQGGFPEAKAFDNDNATRWGSTYNDNQWLYVDLLGTGTISRVYLVWETGYGKDYRIEVGTTKDANGNVNDWKTVSTVVGNKTYFNEINLATAVVGRYVRMYGVTRGSGYGFSLYEFQVNGTFQPLPVTLTSFGAAPQGTGVAVSWATASEQHNAGFEVQRSADGTTFATLATVVGMGTTQNTHAYSYFDAAPLRTTSYYRLKQLDLGGSFAYSPVVAVQAPAASPTTASIYPNPTADRATVTWETPIGSAGRWYLTNNMGQVVHAEPLSGEALSTLALDLQAYPAGSYVLTVESAGKVLRRARVQKSN